MGTKAAPTQNSVTCPPEHKHQKTCYMDHKCRCGNCREYARAQREHYRKQKAYGRPTTDMVDAAPVREHINMLRAAGMGQDRIAALSGVDRGVIRHILYGTGNLQPARRLRARNAEALLRVQPIPDDMYLRDPRGTQRRLQALAMNGWSFARLSQMLDMTHRGISSYQDSIAVTQETHEKVAALFEKLWNVTPPMNTKSDKISVSQTKAWARRNKWVVAMAWDDIDNDPTPAVAGRIGRVSIEDALAGVKLNKQQRRDAIRELHARRWGDPRIARALRVNPKTVLLIRRELGLQAWTKQQQEVA